MLIYFILLFSIVLNIATCMYAVSAARRLFVVDNNIEAIEDTFTSFRSHLEGLYETEMYYGDESLRALIDHSRMVLAEIEKYDNLYLLVLEEEEEEEEEQTEEVQVG